MAPAFLLVDFENVRDLALSGLPPAIHVRIFVGRLQNQIPFKLAEEAQRLGRRLEWIKVEGDGHNNLDFHIAYYLGALVSQHAGATFTVLSRDKGFDALVAHVSRKGFGCQRVESLDQLALPAPPAPEPPEDANFVRVCAVLAKIDKKNRPRKRKTLLHKVAADFQKKLPAKEVERIVTRLFAEKLVAESEGALTYTM